MCLASSSSYTRKYFAMSTKKLSPAKWRNKKFYFFDKHTTREGTNKELAVVNFSLIRFFPPPCHDIHRKHTDMCAIDLQGRVFKA